jgi:outer membrane lipoprotein carrier protein
MVERMRPPGGRIASTLLLAAALVRPAAAERSPEELARALQQQYAAVHDFSADFVQSYTGGVLHKTVTEQGHVLVKKPGLMRWEYTKPEKKLFVSDGVRTYFYVPADRQVFVGRVPTADTADTSVLFLSGKGDLVRDFTASAATPPAGLPGDTDAIKLVPRSPQRDVSWLILAFAHDTLRLRGLVTVDDQGGQSSFVFSDLKENVSIGNDPFTFKVPRGVDVINDSSTGSARP